MKPKIFSIILAVLLGLTQAHAQLALTVPDVNIIPGTKAYVFINVDFGTVAYTAYQFDIAYPEGISAVKSDNGQDEPSFIKGNLYHETQGVSSVFTSSGLSRFQCFSINSDPFTAQSGTLLALPVQASKTLAKGTYQATISPIEFAETDATPCRPGAITFNIIVGDQLMLSEESIATPLAATGVNVCVKLDIAANEWRPIVLPFDMSEEQAKAAFGNDVQLADFNGIKSTYADEDEEIVTNIQVKLLRMTSITANRPCLIKVSEAIDEFTVEGVDINPAETLSVDMDQIGKGTNKNPYLYNSLIGTLVADFSLVKLIEEDSFPLLLSGGKFLYANETTEPLKAFQAYFDFYDVLSDKAAADACITLVFVDASGEIELTTSKIMEADIFDLPYGSYKTGEWVKVEHNTGSSVFFGEEATSFGYSDLSDYETLQLCGTPNQEYTLQMVRSDSRESLNYNSTSVYSKYVTLDEQGKYTLDITEEGNGLYLGLVQIKSRNGEDVASDANGKVFRTLGDEGIVLSGSGSFPEDCENYSFYDVSGVIGNLNLSLANPNALVLGNDNIDGATNLIRRSSEVEQGFTAETLSIVDGKDFCFDFSVSCPSMEYSRSDIEEEDHYISAILPFAVAPMTGVYQYVNCDGKKVYFETATEAIPAYTPIVINVEELTEVTLTGANLCALTPNGVFNLTDAANSESEMKYGYVTKRQEKVPVTTNDEVKDYNVYGYSANSHRFVHIIETFSINPFRAIFLLPKSGAANAPAIRSEAASAPSALTIVIDGHDISTVTSGMEENFFDEDADAPSYNILGIPVDKSYRGIVIRNGKKIINK